MPLSEMRISGYLEARYPGCILLIFGLTPTSAPPENRKSRNLHIHIHICSCYLMSSNFKIMAFLVWSIVCCIQITFKKSLIVQTFY